MTRADQTPARHIFIGDIHGCLSELDELLARIELRTGDRLYFVGDLVDRGPDSVGVVRRVRELLSLHAGSVAVCGNHEFKALRAHERSVIRRDWEADATEPDWAFLRSLALFHRVEELGAIVLHGGLYPALFNNHGPLQPLHEHWHRGGGKRGERTRRLLYVRNVDEAGNMASGDTGTRWTEHYDGREGVVFFGHDPLLDPPEPLITDHAVGLDTGCCFGGRLTAAIVESGGDPRRPAFVSVPGQRYAEPRDRCVE